MIDRDCVRKKVFRIFLVSQTFRIYDLPILESNSGLDISNMESVSFQHFKSAKFHGHFRNCGRMMCFDADLDRTSEFPLRSEFSIISAFVPQI